MDRYGLGKSPEKVSPAHIFTHRDEFVAMNDVGYPLSKWPAEYVAACGDDESGQVSPSLGGETWEGVGVQGVEGSW